MRYPAVQLCLEELDFRRLAIAAGVLRLTVVILLTGCAAEAQGWWQDSSSNVRISDYCYDCNHHQAIAGSDGGLISVGANAFGVWSAQVDKFGDYVRVNEISHRVPQRENNFFPTRATADGNGGVLVTWHHWFGGYYFGDHSNIPYSYATYVQRLDAGGNALWGPFGLKLDGSSGKISGDVDIATDGDGGAIVIWCNSLWEQIRVQRVTSAGEISWGEGGVRLDVSYGPHRAHPRIVADGSGGAICTWFNYEPDQTSYPLVIRAQRINAAGVPQWTPPTVLLAPDVAGMSPDAQPPELTTDGQGGAILAWEDSRGDVFAQRVSGSGLAQWTLNGVALGPGEGLQQSPVVVTDGFGGAVVSWHDLRTTSPGIYAQRLDSMGLAQWKSTGVPLSTAEGAQRELAIAAMPSNEFVVAWADERSSHGLDVYAQKLDLNGAEQWTTGGVAVSRAAEDQSVPEVYVDAQGVSTFTWLDHRPTGWPRDIYGARLKADGTLPEYAPCPQVDMLTLSARGTCESTIRGFRCKVTMDMVVRNLDVKRSAGNVICLYLSDDERFDPTRDSLIQRRRLKRLAPGKTKAWKLSKVLKSDTRAIGKYLIAVIGCNEPFVSPCDKDSRIGVAHILPPSNRSIESWPAPGEQ